MDTDPRNPYQAPAADLGEGLDLPREHELLPFEDPVRHPRFWARVGGMFQLLFSRPTDLFQRVQAGSGFARPLAWSLLLSAPMLLMVVFFLALFGALALLPTAGKNDFPRWLPALMAIGYPLLILVSLVAGMFLGGALNHACLWLWGGLRNSAGLHQTVRAQGYFQGLFMLAYLIPLLNILVALGAPAFLGMGLARLHRTDTWRGVCAAYTPILLCCLLYVGILALVVGAASLSGLR